jgi:hypothetical protein
MDERAQLSGDRRASKLAELSVGSNLTHGYRLICPRNALPRVDTSKEECEPGLNILGGTDAVARSCPKAGGDNMQVRLVLLFAAAGAEPLSNATFFRVRAEGCDAGSR